MDNMQTRCLQAANLAADLTLYITGEKYPDEQVVCMVRPKTFATWYRPPCKRNPGKHLFTFGARMFEHLFYSWDPATPQCTIGREICRYGLDQQLGTATPAMMVSCLITHEIAHMEVTLNYLRKGKPHGPRFIKSLLKLHQQGIPSRAIARLAAQPDCEWLHQPLPGVSQNAPQFNLKKGDRVAFHNRHGVRKQGHIIRVNKKSISLALDGDNPNRWWLVPPHLLQQISNTNN